MSNTYHISNRGEPAPCNAAAGNCPLGGEHYDSIVSAYDALAAEGSWPPVRRKPRFTDAEVFMSQRYADRYVNKELSVENFGIDIVPIFHNGLDEVDWDSITAQSLNLAAFTVTSGQEEVYSATVEHYLLNPDTPSELGATRNDGIEVKAFFDEARNIIEIIDGNHRAAAALLAGRELVIKLAEYPDFAAQFNAYE